MGRWAQSSPVPALGPRPPRGRSLPFPVFSPLPSPTDGSPHDLPPLAVDSRSPAGTRGRALASVGSPGLSLHPQDPCRLPRAGSLPPEVQGRRLASPCFSLQLCIHPRCRRARPPSPPLPPGLEAAQAAPGPGEGAPEASAVAACGNFAVLVDFHVTPQDFSKDTQWFSNHKREEICMLLKDAVESRVEQYLKTRKRHGQGKQLEYARVDPLSMEGDGFYITAYFVKRWDRLQCIGGQQYSELRMFPDRFVICVTRLESGSPLCVSECVAPKENLPVGTSEYFGKSEEDEKYKISLTQEKKKDTLKKIVKRTETKRANESKPQLSKDTVEVYLGSLRSDRE
uniref:protein SLX4IP n=1 Tax=Euleptes europaea TaxID=460621 RepID=UPI00254049A0|nr:protein SLX4IP [Euleptes europaea]